jgi:acyl-CoA synthetase (AMP-forming)/AMP-acid ligase II
MMSGIHHNLRFFAVGLTRIDYTSPHCLHHDLGSISLMLKLSTRSHYHTLRDAVALREGDEMALIYVEIDHPPIHVSRNGFRRAITACATALQSVGIKQRDLVIIAHTQSLESIYAFWGALWMGAIPSMFPTLTEKLDPDIYMHSLAELAAHSNVRAVLTTDDFAPVLAKHVPCACKGLARPRPSLTHGGPTSWERGETLSRCRGARPCAPTATQTHNFAGREAR